MNYRIVSRLLGLLIIGLSFCLFLSLLWSVRFGEREATISFIETILIALGVGGGLYLWGLREKQEVLRKEALFTVSMAWILSALIGSLPFYLSGYIPSFVDAYFESMSGFTTTGASILTNIEAMPKGLLFWRSFTHWLGGMGIIVLFIAILPGIGVVGKFLYRQEAPGPASEELRPRIRDTARLLWNIYLFISLGEAFLLYLSGMDLFDSLCHTFGTMATGGFSTRNSSIGSFNSVTVDIIIIVFMIMAGTNFSLYFHAIKGRFSNMIKNPEFKVFLLTALGGILLIAIMLTYHRIYPSFGSSLRYAAFQAVSILTTTGYTTANFDSWPSFVKILLVAFMFIGGCTGSTGGGLKVIRIIVGLKWAYYQTYRMFHPKAVITIKVGDRALPKETADAIMGSLIIFIFVFVVVSLFMAFLGLDMATALSSAVATLGNIGPGLSGIGPTANYANIPAIGKVVLTFCMLLGRLELYTLLVLLIPSFWKG